MVNQSKQTDPPLSTSDDPLAQAILQCCGPDAVDAYHQGRPYCLLFGRCSLNHAYRNHQRRSHLICGTQTTKRK